MIKTHQINDNILKVYYLLKSLAFRLIKSDKNYRSYELKRLTVELKFLYINFFKLTFSSNILRIFDGSLLFIKKCVNFRLDLAQREIIFGNSTIITRLLVVVQIWNWHITNQNSSKLMRIFQLKVHLISWHIENI